MIEVVDLQKRYGDTEAVRGISFEVRRGEVFGLLGPNGAGKTSTVEVLEGFRSRDGGTVRVLGLDPGSRRDLPALRARVGIVLQQTSHYRYLSVRETLWMHQAYYADPRPIDEVLELVGMGDAAGREYRELSGGQQRRLDVGVALIGRPELVFLDEPTTGFDPAARRQFWDTIGGLRDLGTTVVLTTHYMEEAQALADRVAVMHGGHIVGTGTAADLARNLELASTLSFRLPEGMSVSDLPEDACHDSHVRDGVVTMQCPHPTQAMATLCSWAIERGIELRDLELRAPSLEDSYLTLTSSDKPADETQQSVVGS